MSFDETITLSQDQVNAVDAISAWYKSGKTKVFVMAGVAGSGKTTLIPRIIDAIGLKQSSVAFCAYTGKAALVMKQKHGLNASTIHRFMYIPRVFTNKDGEQEVIFVRAPSIPPEIKLIVVDEASMVPQDIHDDLRRYNVPILYIGDHFQLPPVSKDEGLFEFQGINIKLENIHRQAEKSPIILASAKIREGFPLTYGGESNFFRVRAEEIEDQTYQNVDQIICGYNTSRSAINAFMRELQGYEGLPKNGERLIVLRNNYNLGVVNGQQLLLMADMEKAKIRDHLRAEFIDLWDTRDAASLLMTEVQKHEIHRAIFDGNPEPKTALKNKKVIIADFAYGITCHKAQGSEWEKVLVYDDGFAYNDAETRQRWLYTAVTRATDLLILAVR